MLEGFENSGTVVADVEMSEADEAGTLSESIPFSELLVAQVNDLLSNLFSCATKVNNYDYQRATLANMLGGFYRVLLHASDLRLMREDQLNVLHKKIYM